LAYLDNRAETKNSHVDALSAGVRGQF
jgi:hypothetical protein